MLTGMQRAKRDWFAKIGYKPHPQQWSYHDSVARFRIPCCGRRFGKSTMAGRDLEPYLFTHNKRYWIVGPCVDELTEIFTDRGWLRYDEVCEGDRTLSINPDTGLSEWDEVRKVLRYPGVHRVVRMSTHSFDAVSTGHHRWLSNSTNRHQSWVWRTTDTLRPTDRIPKAVPHTDLPTVPKYSDELVELLAWLWTEGSVVNGKDFRISQSLVANPEKVDRIRRAAQGLSRHESVTHDGTMVQFYFDGDLFWPHLSRHKVVKPEFIKELTAAQLRLFVDVSVLGDGRGNCVYQNNEEQLFAVQMAATLLGLPTSLKRRGDGQYVLSLLTKSYAAVRSMETQEIAYEGEVWCVSTRNMNWLARRRGSVYYTGNTYDLAEKEFRVVWDDLIVKLALGKDKRVKRAYNKKQGDMYIQFPWGTRLEVRSADHPEFLVGEALDGAIMSEAAKQKKETWERFIRPSLADRRGWATFPTTPEGQNWLYEEWQRGADPRFPDFQSWKFPSWANTAVYPGGFDDPEIKLLLQTTTKEWFEQEIGADFTSFVGKILTNWDEFANVRPHTFRPEWPNYIAFDWGFTNPLAAIEFQVSPWDTVHVWREHYKSYLTLDDHIELLKAREQPPGYHLDLAFGDAADPEAALNVSRKLVGCIADPEAKKKHMWGVGINIMNDLMKANREIGTDDYGTPLYEPAYFVDPSCTHTIKEHNNYRSKEPIKGQNVPELGRNVEDHTIDALRYALVQLFYLGTNHHLSEIYAPDGYETATVEATRADRMTTSEFAELQERLVRSAPLGHDAQTPTSEFQLSPAIPGYFGMGKEF